MENNTYQNTKWKRDQLAWRIMSVNLLKTITNDRETLKTPNDKDILRINIFKNLTTAQLNIVIPKIETGKSQLSYLEYLKIRRYKCIIEPSIIQSWIDDDLQTPTPNI